jgi:hypothetical protein
MRQNWIRNIVGGLSFTTALFIFQACYGTPQDFGLDVFVEGKVVSKTTGEPIKGIKVSAASLQHTVTDDKGVFSFYTVKSDQLQISFEDVDGVDNGTFIRKDSLVSIVKDKIYLDIKLENGK